MFSSCKEVRFCAGRTLNSICVNLYLLRAYQGLIQKNCHEGTKDVHKNLNGVAPEFGVGGGGGGEGRILGKKATCLCT